jgi:hypothetical protein
MYRFLIFLCLAVILIFTACSANQSCFSVTFQNNSDKDATLVFGNYNIFTLKGSSVTYFYVVEDKNAMLSFQGVKAEKFYYFHDHPGNTIIDDNKEVKGLEQKFNIQYYCKLYTENGQYKWDIISNYVGNNTGNAVYPKYLF